MCLKFTFFYKIITVSNQIQHLYAKRKPIPMNAARIEPVLATFAMLLEAGAGAPAAAEPGGPGGELSVVTFVTAGSGGSTTSAISSSGAGAIAGGSASGAATPMSAPGSIGYSVMTPSTPRPTKLPWCAAYVFFDG